MLKQKSFSLVELHVDDNEFMNDQKACLRQNSRAKYNFVLAIWHCMFLTEY